jgi:hypothetical protein
MNVTWTFYLERFCGILKMALRSRSQPWSNLSKRNLHVAYLNQISIKYQLDKDLSATDYRGDELRRNEVKYSGCK